LSHYCSACAHEKRAEIDRALLGGASLRDVAGQFGLSKSAVARHKDEHIPETLAKSKQAQEAARADDLLAQVKALQAKTVQTLLKAEKDGDGRLVLAAVREARGNLELLAKLLGELDERPVVNLVLSPEWLAVRGAIFLALTPHPAARLDVANALASLENGNGARH
jgi:hypothetical protein